MEGGAGQTQQAKVTTDFTSKQILFIPVSYDVDFSSLFYRVEYRHELQLAREEERKEAAERALQEHREREKRLEVVKQQAS